VGGRVGVIVYSTPDRNATPDRNEFFSIPGSVIRRRAELPAPAPGQPGPFSLGGDGAIQDLFRRAGLSDIEVHKLDAPLRLASTADCLRFEQESFGTFTRCWRASTRRGAPRRGRRSSRHSGSSRTARISWAHARCWSRSAPAERQAVDVSACSPMTVLMWSFRGLEDLFGLVCRLNLRRVTAEHYRTRVKSKQIAGRWLRVQILDARV
jgi:hypothetical protein